jgi:hypothetical protein
VGGGSEFSIRFPASATENEDGAVSETGTAVATQGAM